MLRIIVFLYAISCSLIEHCMHLLGAVIISIELKMRRI